jgi:hypothetical protein
MKKIIFTMLLVSSTLLFAKSEEPRIKKESSKKPEKVLNVKENVLDKNLNKKIEVKAKIIGMDSATCFAIAELVGSYNPVGGASIMVNTCIPLAQAGF